MPAVRIMRDRAISDRCWIRSSSSRNISGLRCSCMCWNPRRRARVIAGAIDLASDQLQTPMSYPAMRMESDSQTGGLVARGDRFASLPAALHLVSLVTQVAALHPSDGQEVNERTQRTVAKTVLGRAREAMAVFHRRFEH